MDRFADERDNRLLEKDKYTFFVLRRIMGGPCELFLSDHERLIICFSCHPYPVWIWTADDAADAEMERAYRESEEHGLLDGNHTFILKYDLANYFIKRASADGKTLSLCKNMFAYDCPEPIKPNVTVYGSFYRCGMGDVEALTDFIEEFHREVNIDLRDRNAYRADAEASILAGNTFFWKDERGEPVASCRYAVRGDTASLGLVYTRPAFRRKHYVQNLVYEATKLAKEAGYVPMLYTDADYIASNACYEKIGYRLRGKLCTIG